MQILGSFTTSLIRVGLLVALAVPGFVLRKLKKLPDNSIAVLSALIIYISQPMLSLYSFIKVKFSSELLANMGIAFLFAIVFNLGLILVAKLIFLKDKNVDAGKVCSIGSALSNCGFMGIPVIEVLFNDSQITIYALIYLTVFNIVLWTLGVYFMTGDKKYVSVKKALLNLPTIVLVVALPVFFLNLNLTSSTVPAVQAVMRFCQYFNDFNAPLPMLIMGIRLADVKFKEVFNSGRVYLVSLLKLIVFPVIALLTMYLVSLIPAVNLDGKMITSILICVAMPTATMTMTFAEIFNGDRYTAVKITLQTTLFSIVTIPLFVTLLTVFGYVGL